MFQKLFRSRSLFAAVLFFWVSAGEVFAYSESSVRPVIEPQTFFKRDITISAAFDEVDKKLGFRFTVPAAYFPEGTFLKLVYSVSDPSVAYDGNNWIWYETNKVSSVTYSISKRNWSSGGGNDEVLVDMGSEMPGYFRLCAVTPKQVRNCSEKALVSKDFENYRSGSQRVSQQPIVSPVPVGNVEKTANVSKVAEKTTANWALKGRVSFDSGIDSFFFSWEPDWLDFMLLLGVFFLATLYLVLRFGKAGTRSVSVVKSGPSKTVVETAEPSDFTTVRPSDILRIFRSGNEYRMEFGDLYEKGIKVPVENRENILAELKRFVKSMHRLAPSRGIGEELSNLELDVPNLEKFGHTLFRIFLSERIRTKIGSESGPLTIRTDDQEIPWELLHNGNEFLCLTRPIGREILTTSVIRRNEFKRARKPKILIIADPTSDLAGAREEAVKIAGLLSEKAEIKTLIGDSASASEIFTALSRSDWDVIHYAGHARFREDAPDESGLVLSGGQVVSVTEIKRTLSGRPLVFLNACSSGVAKADSNADGDSGELDVVGLSAAFVIGGALGAVSTLWPVHDRVASVFSVEFYNALLAGRSVGESVLDAKRVAKANDPTAVNWASFVYYGNPNFKLNR